MLGLTTLAGAAQTFALLVAIILGLATLGPASAALLPVFALGFVIATTFSLIACCLDARKGAISFMIDVFLLFFVALPAFHQVQIGLFPWFVQFHPNEVAQAYFLLAIAFISYHLAWIAHGVMGWRLPAAAGTCDTLFLSKAAWFIAILALFLVLLAGPSFVFIPRFERAPSGFDGFTQHAIFIARSLGLLALVIICLLLTRLDTGDLRRQNLIAAFLLIPLFLALHYPPALPRFMLFGTALCLAAIWIDFFAARIKIWCASSAAIGVFVLFPAIKVLGTGTFSLSALKDRANWEAIQAYALRVDFDAFMQIAQAARYIETGLGPYRLGENFLGALLFFVPRAFWENKPIDSGQIVASALGQHYTNVSSPLQAEAFLAFGLMGVIAVFAILGVVIRTIEDRQKPPSLGRLATYAMLAGFITITLRGAITSVVPHFASAFLVLFALSIASRLRTKRAAPADPYPWARL